MPASPARAAAFEILLRIDRAASYATELLHSARLSNLSSSDHGLATELVMGVLRWRSVLDRHVEGTSSQKLERIDSEVLAALRLGVYQLRFLSRIPARAAIFESVELVKAARKRSAAPFVNAVLRKVSSQNQPDFLAEIEAAQDVNSLAQSSAHPEWLVKRWVECYGLETTKRLCRHNQTVPTTTIHVSHDRSLQELEESGVEVSCSLLLSCARHVVSGDTNKAPAFREGRISIQDEGSQLVALLVGDGERILDCCAAPGSKTALIAKKNPQVKVIATDLHPHRARLLRSLVRLPNVHVLAADARCLPFNITFDRMLADVPCSGTGTLARNPEIKWRLTADDLLDLQSRQMAILKSALAQLAPGGRLVYSTCSLEPGENEAVVEATIGAAPAFTIVDCRTELDRLQRSGDLLWNDIDSLLSGPYMRTLPGIHPCDGFFAAVIERKG